MPIDPRDIEVIDDRIAAILRDKTGAERLRIASDMFAFARTMVTAGVKHQYPDWDERQVAREVVRRLSHGAA